MSYLGNGVFSINSAGQPVATNTTIAIAPFNTLTADLATGLSTAICRDGQSTTTAQIPFAVGASFGAAIVYGGVTLSNAVTGTGNMVLSANSTLTGTTTAAILRTTSGTQALPTATPTTFVALPAISNGTWLISVAATVADASFSSVAIAVQDSSAVAITTILAGANMAITASGLNIRAQQPAGLLTATWSILRVA